MPQVCKRRPLVIRKNNFVLTKRDDGSQDSGSGAPPGSATNALSKVRIHHPQQSTANKFNMTLHSNNSGNRALNNTQKIGRPGAGLNSNESIGSEVSLSQTRQKLGQTLAAVNASIKKEQLKRVSEPLNLPGGGSIESQPLRSTFHTG